MKVAIYTISKNEANNVKQFMEAADGAPVYVVDTGSTDNTVELLKKYGAVVKEKSIVPWRFDVARNEALALVPEDIDICISIDMDEVLETGWKKQLQKDCNGNFGSYRYIAEWYNREKTIPSVEGPRSKIHSRHEFKWEKPVHEMLVPLDGVEVKNFHTSMLVKHYQDNRPRSYIYLLDEILKDNPNDDLSWLQRASENLINKNYEEAVEDYNRYLKLVSGDEDPMVRHKRSVCYIALAECYFFLKKSDFEIIGLYLKALAEHPESREPWVHLSNAFFSVGNFPLSYGFAMQAINIKENPYYATVDYSCWTDGPNKLANESFIQLMKGIK
jgi:glycosyltransferase involved in cell wall biosynthesis